ncbi:hypothetical protein [Demequina sp. NBRC 110055]|uniref:hypothetical protein n=1 Tax=Demequina sp. NBRC 110055 TaxID=1570344 RepID=UPI001185569F|nr:hypothetical protein [Demequina sp. NBRC 110055]
MTSAESPSSGDNPVFSVSQQHHIDLIQAIIVRMSTSSATAKSWLLPVVTATYGYALTQQAWTVATLGVLATVLFWNLDIRYLREERAYRALFSDVVSGKTAPYNLNASVYYRAPLGGAADCRAPNCRWRKVAGSWATLGFYGPVAIVGTAIAVVAH